MKIETPKGPIQSVSRAAMILRCFLKYQELSLQEISEMVGLHKSTASTLVTTLKNEQLLEQNATNGKYCLGMTSFLLGSNTKVNLLSIAQPYLNTLNEHFHETVNLASYIGTDIIYISKLESEYSMRTCTRIGQRLPFYCTANGKSIFCHYDTKELDDIIKDMEMEKFTPNTIANKEQLYKELSQSYANGYSCDQEELELGLCCYAAPIFSNEKIPVAAISISGPSSRLQTSIKDDMIAELKEYANDISDILKKCNYTILNY